LATAIADTQHSWRERVKAVRELGRSRDPRAEIPLLTALKAEIWQVRVNAAVALGKLGSHGAVPALVEALRADDRKEVRMQAAFALGRIGDPTSAEALAQATSDRASTVRNTAQSALKKVERVAAARVAADPESVDEASKAAAANRRDRWGFNLPFIFAGLIAYGAVSYWAGGSDALGTALPVIIGVAVFALVVNLLRVWWVNRNRT